MQDTPPWCVRLRSFFSGINYHAQDRGCLSPKFEQVFWAQTGRNIARLCQDTSIAHEPERFHKRMICSQPVEMGLESKINALLFNLNLLDVINTHTGLLFLSP